HEQLDQQRRGYGARVIPVRQMLDVPAGPGGERAVLVVVVHCGEVAPVAGAARGGYQNGAAGEERNPPPPPGKSGGPGAGGPARAETWAQSARGEEDRDESRLKQHSVRLVRREIPQDGDEAQKKDRARRRHRSRKDVRDEQQRAKNSQSDGDAERRIARARPE